MPPVATNSNFRKAFDGYTLYTLDDGTGANVYGFPSDSFGNVSDDGNSYPSQIDASSVQIHKIRGIKSGPIQQTGLLRIDRGMSPFLTSAFGGRTAGKLTPWIATISEYSGAAAYAAAALWFRRFQLQGQFGMRGQDAALRYMLDGMLLDPDNTLGAGVALPAAAAGGSGTVGAGDSTFGGVVFDNNGAGVYDGIRSFSLAGDNGTTVDPSVKDNVNLLAAGMTPAQFAGSLTLTQLKGAANPIPQVSGEYPMRINIKSGDGLHTMQVRLMASYMARNQTMTPEGYTARVVTYRTLGLAPGGADPMTFSYT